MKRLVLTGVFINLALLIIGVTWISPVEEHRDRAQAASPASVAPPLTAPPLTAPASIAPASTAPASTVAGDPLTVALNQWSIAPQASQVPAGPVTFTVSNDGTMTH